MAPETWAAITPRRRWRDHTHRARLLANALAGSQLLGVAILMTTPSPLPAAPPGTQSSWQMVFEDNFTGSALDRSKWLDAYAWGRTHNYNAYCAPENVIITNGLLRLKAEDKAQYDQEFTTGVVSTYGKFSTTYGYIEGRFKVPPGDGETGLWPAFWLIPDDLSWPPEIDIFEFFGTSWGLQFSSWRCPEGSGADQKQLWDRDYSTDFHTYAVDWRSDGMSWYIDGVKKGDFPVNCNTKNMYLVVCFGVEYNENGNPSWFGRPAPGTLPAYLDCDWVRVWKRASTATIQPAPRELTVDCAPDHVATRYALDGRKVAGSLDTRGVHVLAGTHGRAVARVAPDGGAR